MEYVRVCVCVCVHCVVVGKPINVSSFIFQLLCPTRQNGSTMHFRSILHSLVPFSIYDINDHITECDWVQLSHFAQFCYWMCRKCKIHIHIKWCRSIYGHSFWVIYVKFTLTINSWSIFGRRVFIFLLFYKLNECMQDMPAIIYSWHI